MENPFYRILGGSLFPFEQEPINSWTNKARIMKGSMPPKCQVSEVRCILEKAGLKNKNPKYNDSRIVLLEGHEGIKMDGLEHQETASAFFTRRCGISAWATEARSYRHVIHSSHSRSPLASLYRHPGRKKKPPHGRQVRWRPIEGELWGCGKREDGGSACLGRRTDGNSGSRGHSTSSHGYGHGQNLMHRYHGTMEWEKTATPPLDSPQNNLELQLGSQQTAMARDSWGGRWLRRKQDSVSGHSEAWRTGEVSARNQSKDRGEDRCRRIQGKFFGHSGRVWSDHSDVNWIG